MEKKFNKLDVDFVIYHKGCSDGFGSAFSIWKLVGDKPTYVPCNFGDPIPDVTGKNVAMCDFSYSKDIILDMITKANSFIVIDHHKTAEANLKDIPDEYKIFDMNHSGAYLTWKYFHPDEEVPDLILYIEDRDIWKHSLPNTHEFFSKFKDIAFSFEEYNKLLEQTELNKVIEEGRIINEYDKKQMDWIMNHACCCLSILPNGEIYNIVYLSSNLYKSDLGNKLLSKFPHADFSVIYSYDDYKKITLFSLRSCNDRTDVSMIAKLFGGGGHRNASGCMMYGNHCYLEPPITNYDFDFVFNSYNIYDTTLPSSNQPDGGLYMYRIISFNMTIHKKEIARYLLRILDKTCCCVDVFTINEKDNTTEHMVIFRKEYINKDTIGAVDRFIEYHCGDDEELIEENKKYKTNYIKFTKKRQINRL